MRRVLICAVIAALVSPVMAQNAGKRGQGRGNQAVTNMMKNLEAVELTSEQKVKIEKAAEELKTSLVALQSEGFKPDWNKQKAEAMKKAREEGVKGKELESKVLASLDLTDDQKAVLKKHADAMTKFQRAVATTLTSEQIEKLPQQLKTQLTRALPKGKQAKGKKNAA